MSKNKAGQAKQQARTKAKVRRQAKRRGKRPIREMRRNQAGIARKLLAGEVPLVCATAWGFVEGVLNFMGAVGFWEVLDIEGKRFERKMVSVCQLLATYEMKALLGIVSINQVGVKLFREAALLRLVGYSTQQLREGICQRGYGDHKPMHGRTLASALERLTESELDWLLQETVQRLVKRQLLWSSNGHYALDASDMATSPKFKGGGRKTTTERRLTRPGEWVETLKTMHGLKLLIVYEVKLRLVVAAKIVPIEQHESQFTLELVRQAQRNLATDHPIRVLLIDRGFLDGETLWTLKDELNIDWVIPARSDMDITTDARQLAQQPVDPIFITSASRPATGLRGRGQVSARGVFGLTTFSTYGDAAHQHTLNRHDFKPNLVNALVITRWRDKPSPLPKQPVFLTSLDVSQPVRILDLYDLRSLIENTAFRELKQGWHLTAFPTRTLSAARAHVYLTLLCFTLVNAYHTQRGQALARNGIRRHRAHHFECLLIMVVDDLSHSFALFHIEELLTLLGHPPTICLTIQPDEVLSRYAA
jgi:hypothetical protein